MDYLKQLLFNRFKTFVFLTFFILLSAMLLMIRVKLTHSFYFLFLVWNLFLAVIPFAITTYLVSIPKLKKISFIIWFGIWLLFLPNAPYIVTDLIHLRLSEGTFLYLDILIVSAFAFSGLLLFYLSILDMKSKLTTYLKENITNYIIIAILFLSAFGVFLGRFLRYNSWEILSNPKYLFIDITNIALNPITYKGAWVFTTVFGLFLSLGYWLFNKIFNKNGSKKNNLIM